MKGFLTPVRFHEGDREPVKELGVGGLVAHQTEIRLGGDEAVAEVALPEAVDGDAGGEGVTLVGEPSS